MSQKLLEADATYHPAHYIAEELAARGWTRQQLALAVTIHDFHVNLLAVEMYLEIGATTPDLRMGDDMARRYANAFGVSEDLFIKLEQTWLDKRAEELARTEPTEPTREEPTR